MALTAESMLCPLTFVRLMVFDSSVPSELFAETVRACASLPNCKALKVSAVLLETPLASTYVDLAVDAVSPPAAAATPVVPKPMSPVTPLVLPALLRRKAVPLVDAITRSPLPLTEALRPAACRVVLAAMPELIESAMLWALWPARVIGAMLTAAPPLKENPNCAVPPVLVAATYAVGAAIDV